MDDVVEGTASERADGPVVMIRGRLVALGPLDRRYLPLFLTWMNDPEVTRGLGRSGPYTLEDEQRWYDSVTTSPTSVAFLIYELASQRPIGTTGLHDIQMRQRRATFGINIGDKTSWNRGYGTEATRLVLDYAFNLLGLHNVMLSVYSFNHRAQRAYEKAGYRVIGRRRGTIYLTGQWHDEVLMDAVPEEFHGSVLAPLLNGQQAQA